MAFKFLKVPDFLKKIGLKTVKELIGVDIGTTSIKLCVLKYSKNGFTLQNIAQKYYGEDLLSDGSIINDAFVAQELKQLILENKISSRDAACALSSYAVITKRVTVPFLEEEVLENTINLEVENVIPFPLKDIYYSYYILGVDEEKQDMMDIQIVAAKKEIVDSYIKVFNMAGLNLHILDVDIFAITNLIEQIYNPKDISVVAVDIGSSVTNIAIIKGENIEFTREILMGGRYLTEKIEKSTKLQHKEAEEKKTTGDSNVSYLFEDFTYNITSEINKTINFYASTKPNENIGKIYLTGGSSLLQGLKERISEDTKVEVEYLNPFLLLNEDQKKISTYEQHKEFSPVAFYLSTRVTDIGS
jgi:type IV pilus assembly protein PilM